MTSMQRAPMALKIYQAATRLAAPIANAALDKRLRIGKEEEARINERRGIATLERPAGAVVWIHGASVGESLSVLPLVDALSAAHRHTQFLVTTGTVTSAKLLHDQLPPAAFHQYAPLDHPNYVSRFFDHWRPNAAIFVESEFWPNLILAAGRHAKFKALINGRVSPNAFAGWKTHPNSIKFLTSNFDVIIGQDHQNAERLRELSGRDVKMYGNLKNAAAPLSANQEVLEALHNTIGNRHRWLAASTHPGEETIAISAHQQLAQTTPDVLTIIAPRHPNRGDAITSEARAKGLNVAQRSKNDPLTNDTEVYIADTLGELGSFYRLADITFIGGAITPIGGHNPLEPARLGASILHGPETFNFTDTYKALRSAGGAGLVRNDRELASAIKRLFSDDKTRNAMAVAAKATADESAKEVLEKITATLSPNIEAAVAAT